MYGTKNEWQKRRNELDKMLNILYSEREKLNDKISIIEQEKTVLNELEELWKKTEGNKNGTDEKN